MSCAECQGCHYSIDVDPEDVLQQADTVCFSDLEAEELISQTRRAGIDDDTDAFTFMEMNGRNVFVTEV